MGYDGLMLFGKLAGIMRDGILMLQMNTNFTDFRKAYAAFAPTNSRFYTLPFRFILSNFVIPIKTIMDIIGNKFEVDFGMAKAILLIESETQLTFTITEKGGEQVNDVETVQTKMTELRPNLYLITWQEASGTTVTQVHDHENEAIYSNWTSRDGGFNNMQGTLKRV